MQMRLLGEWLQEVVAYASSLTGTPFGITRFGHSDSQVLQLGKHVLGAPLRRQGAVEPVAAEVQPEGLGGARLAPAAGQGPWMATEDCRVAADEYSAAADDFRLATYCSPLAKDTVLQACRMHRVCTPCCNSIRPTCQSVVIQSQVAQGGECTWRAPPCRHGAAQLAAAQLPAPARMHGTRSAIRASWRQGRHGRCLSDTARLSAVHSGSLSCALPS